MTKCPSMDTFSADINYKESNYPNFTSLPPISGKDHQRIDVTIDCECNMTCELVVINDEHLQLLKELETSTMPETTQQELMV